jgi:predicted O-linked N-acetylglucosamine transferase (SPINDLY family)
MATADELYAEGARHHREGRWPQAEQALRAALAAAPDHVSALHVLGLMTLQRGWPAEAAALLRRAVGLRPDNAELRALWGTACQHAGRLDEAAAHLRHALGLDPRCGMALNNLGIVLVGLGRPAEAVALLEQARALDPGDAGTISNLAAALRAAGDVDGAARAYAQAVRLAPALPQPHNNLGNLHQEAGRFAEAEACFREAVRVDPGFALAHANLANLLATRGRFGEAVDSYRRALACGHRDPAVAGRLAHALLQMNRPVEALAACQAGLQRVPRHPALLNDAGNALRSLERLGEAAEHYRRASAVALGWSVPHYNLGVALANQGRMAEARDQWREALRLNPTDSVAHSTYAASLHYDPEATGAAILAEHLRWAACHTAGIGGPVPHANAPDPERRLRVGYVSPDFRNHATAYFLHPVLAHHDPAAVEVFCYAEVTAPDEGTARLRAVGHHWRDTPGLADDELAALIRRDGIDVLVELGGHMAGNRLLTFARRPAPVQLAYLGYPGTTGLPAIPFRLADAVIAGPGEPVAPHEELVLLPGGFCCYGPPAAMPIDPEPPSRRAGAVTFGSLHKLDKLNDAVLGLWRRLLEGVPGSRLLVARSSLQGETADWWRRHLGQQGLPMDRVSLGFAQPVGMAHLATYNQIDVGLDVWPWCGHTTACEALWMGVPVVTLLGDRLAGRMTASVLHAVGHPEWVATTPDDYLRVARELAGDGPGRARLRAELRPGLLASPLCDGPAFTRGLEDAYRRLWRRWCAGGGPAQA